MHLKNILPLLALASAAPLLNPRALVTKTVTDEVVVTITDYTTIWVTPGAKPTDPVQGPSPTTTVVATTAVPPQQSPVVSSPVVVAPPPVQTTVVPTTSPPPPPPPVHTSKPPSTPSPPVVVSSSTSTPPVVLPTTTTTAVPAAQPTTPSTGGGKYPVETLTGATQPDGPCTADTPCVGEITHYDVGLGACGYKDWTTQSLWTKDDLVVAIPKEIFGSFSNGGTADSVNKLCQRSVKIKAQPGGQDVIARVVDRCAGCNHALDLDLSDAAFQKVAPSGNGRVAGIQWEWV